MTQRRSERAQDAQVITPATNSSPAQPTTWPEWPAA